MKRLEMIFLILSILLYLMINSSCKKEETTTKNIFYYNDCQYEIPKGFIASFYENDSLELFAHFLCLYSGNRNIMRSNDTIILTGEGDMIFLIFLTSTEFISSSTYNYAPSDELISNSFEGFFFFDTTEECLGTVSFIEEGNILIQKKSTNYIISIDCIDNLGGKLSGKYDGVLSIEYLGNFLNTKNHDLFIFNESIDIFKLTNILK